jgi:hypothetical protein
MYSVRREWCKPCIKRTGFSVLSAANTRVLHFEQIKCPAAYMLLGTCLSWTVQAIKAMQGVLCSYVCAAD